VSYKYSNKSTSSMIQCPFTMLCMPVLEINNNIWKLIIKAKTKYSTNTKEVCCGKENLENLSTLLLQATCRVNSSQTLGKTTFSHSARTSGTHLFSTVISAHVH